MLKILNANFGNHGIGAAGVKHSRLVDNKAAFGQMRSDLQKNHAGEWVAIVDRKLVDSDKEKGALVKRLSKRDDCDSAYVIKIGKKSVAGSSPWSFLAGKVRVATEAEKKRSP